MLREAAVVGGGRHGGGPTAMWPVGGAAGTGGGGHGGGVGWRASWGGTGGGGGVGAGGRHGDAAETGGRDGCGGRRGPAVDGGRVVGQRVRRRRWQFERKERREK
jgi:hypothetical protein